MKDGYGRDIDYLRLSITDKCNFRCRYCMPEEGIRHLSHGDVLSFEEIVRIVRIMTGLGIKRVRLTGGEPLVRRGAADLVAMIPCDTYITTNGFMLDEMAEKLKNAGLCGVNVSLDTLDRNTFFHLTGTDGIDKVKIGILSAMEAGLSVKLNCVPIRGVNDSELELLCDHARKIGADIRFIELMPIGCGKDFKGIPSNELLSRFESAFGKGVQEAGSGNGPAVYYTFGGHKGRIGFISPMSHKFCSSCNRVRLTAEGYLKLCLQFCDGYDLRSLIRSGADDEVIRQAIEIALIDKPQGHSFGKQQSDTRKMVQIGG